MSEQYEALLAHAGRVGVSINTIDPRGRTPADFNADDELATTKCLEERHTELVHTQQQLADWRVTPPARIEIPDLQRARKYLRSAIVPW